MDPVHVGQEAAVHTRPENRRIETIVEKVPKCRHYNDTRAPEICEILWVWDVCIEEVWRKKPRQLVVLVLWGKIAAHIASLSLRSRQNDKRRAGS